MVKSTFCYKGNNFKENKTKRKTLRLSFLFSFSLLPLLYCYLEKVYVRTRTCSRMLMKRVPAPHHIISMSSASYDVLSEKH